MTPDNERSAIKPAIFPAAMARALAAKPHLTPKVLRGRFPWAIDALSKSWGKTPEFTKACDVLILDAREGANDLPEDAIQELVVLKKYHIELFFVPKRGDPKLVTPEMNLATAQRQALAPAAPNEPSIPNWPLVRTLQSALSMIDSPPRKSNRRLGEILISVGALDQAKLDWALSFQSRVKTSNKRFTISKVLVASKAARPDQVAAGLCMQNGWMLLDLDSMTPDPLAQKLLPDSSAIDFGVVAAAASARNILIACTGPHCFEHSVEIAAITQRKVVLAHASQNAINRRHQAFLPFNGHSP